MFARRSVVGSRPSAWPSATFSFPTARAAAFVLPTSAERSSRRAASVPTSRDESTRKRVSAGSSSVSWPTSRREVESSGLKYFAASPASWPRPAYCSAKPWMTLRRPPRVRSSSVLKSWSRSTTDVVDSVVSVAPSGSSRASSGPGESAT